MARRPDHVAPGGQVKREMNGGNEPLGSLCPAKVCVTRGQELRSGYRAEQAAERARKEQRPGPRVDAFARDIHDGDFERLAVAYGHHEVAAERRSSGWTQYGLAAPAFWQARQRALRPDAVTQLDEHLIAAQTE